MNPKEKNFEKLDRKKKKKETSEEQEKTKKSEHQRDLEVADDLHALVSVLREQKFQDFVRYLKSPWRIMWSNFLAGIFRGLGILVGLTMIVGLVIWLIKELVDFPLIGKYIDIIFNWIQNFLPPELLQQLQNLQENPDVY